MIGKKKQKQFVGYLVVLFLFSVMSVNGYAQIGIPKTINYQGYLTNRAGSPIEGQRDMTFRIYDSETAEIEAAIWSETQTVTLYSGIYSVVLGAVDTVGNPLDLPFDRQYWLGVQIVGETNEMTSRQKLTSVPTAFNADMLDGKDAGDLQDRISGTCAAGSSIRVVNADGTVMCEIDDDTAEADPTVPASIKDGIDWTEISSIPAGFDDGIDNALGMCTTRWSSNVNLSGTSTTVLANCNLGETPISGGYSALVTVTSSQCIPVSNERRTDGWQVHWVAPSATECATNVTRTWVLCCTL